MASIAPDWLKTVVPTNWFDPYSRPFNEYRLPQKEAERLELGEQIGRDGIYLLTHVYAKTSQPELRLLTQVEVLHRVWVLQYYQDENDQTHWRRKGNLPPGEHILTSPYDTDARLSKKRESIRVGYKVHLTETHDDDKPHLITHVETTLATEPDSELWKRSTLNWVEKIVYPVSICLTTAMPQQQSSPPVGQTMALIC